MHSIFDLDDLEFLRTNGLGLRHVELAKGLDEQQNGSDRGDAVSLANYGLNEKYSSFRHLVTDENCITLQKEIENFIFQSFKCFHRSSYRYQDAAFHLMSRGDEARIPYDFGSTYPLGKCGTRAFTADQIVFSIFTDSYQNEDIAHATEQVFLEFKNKFRQLKIQKIQTWLAQIQQSEATGAKRLAALLVRLIDIYSENSYLVQPVYKKLELLLKQEDYPLASIEELEAILQTVGAEKKGELTLIYTYKEECWDAMDEYTLKEKLLHYVRNQNLEKVKICLSRLEPSSFATLDWPMGCPLQVAASFSSIDILEAVYGFYPQRYDLLVQNENLATPIFFAFRAGEFKNTDFLLSQRPMLIRDLSCSRQHIFSNPPEQFTENYFQTLDHLLQQGATVGNELSGLFENPFAICVRQVGFSGCEPTRFFSRFLPLTDYHSKYWGLLSCANELYFLCDHSTTQLLNDSPYVEIFLGLQSVIFASLTEEECRQINELVRKGIYSGNARERLLNDLAGLPGAENKRKVQLCFNTEIKQVEEPNYQTANPYRWSCLKPNPLRTEEVADYDDLSESGMTLPACSIF
ncbi:hypothetical protein BN59_02989 [Legionella massiliensis]|uniref:Uncharacterized protein n=1 Tax=Legionella massiliensis TaxID=1034943 RepID=A0A078L081_9GAMM|nr:hypothetical protein [Legionella massiliensis]CDZ78677.1 hypothetical protein BN59_02989 [Legionella massiliensis]CEE14415.1 hypothetical protein BN1094_02989 [Legionella massiliensis]